MQNQRYKCKICLEFIACKRFYVQFIPQKTLKTGLVMVN